jgi:[acyl-carrier-protein] S-malonyltransferase
VGLPGRALLTVTDNRDGMGGPGADRASDTGPRTSDLVLLFPGQGSQKPGMGRDLAEAYPDAARVFATVDEALGEPLTALCFDGPADLLTLTHNAQPALLAHGAALLAALGPLGGRVRAAAGHSLGELSAHHAVGTFALPDAARLVRRRGELMYDAGVRVPGTMAAILGDTARPIEEICDAASNDPEGGLVVPANFNGPGQVVISGAIAGVEKAMELARSAGAKRAIRLAVSGAFHSPLMAPARDGFAEALNDLSLCEPSAPVYANVTAEPVRTASRARELLIEQLTAPVRWSELVSRLAAHFPGALFVELGPGNVLTGLVKKIVPGVNVMSCGTAGDVEALRGRLQ